MVKFIQKAWNGQHSNDGAYFVLVILDRFTETQVAEFLWNVGGDADSQLLENRLNLLGLLVARGQVHENDSGVPCRRQDNGRVVRGSLRQNRMEFWDGKLFCSCSCGMRGGYVGVSMEQAHEHSEFLELGDQIVWRLVGT